MDQSLETLVEAISSLTTPEGHKESHEDINYDARIALGVKSGGCATPTSIDVSST